MAGEDEEFFEDLAELAAWTPSREEMYAQFPEVQPAVRTMYGDPDGLGPVGYSDDYYDVTIVPLDRTKYLDYPAAEARMEELVRLRNIRVVGVPFYTARHWCFRTVAR